jgi:molybdate transport system substrate-binding protein
MPINVPSTCAARVPLRGPGSRWITAAVVMTSLACGPRLAEAAQIKVFSANGMKPIVSAIAPRFEMASGDKLLLDFAETGELLKSIANGETADVFCVPQLALDELTRQGKIAPAIKATVASTTLGLAVRDGAPTPATASVDAFRKWLLTANSIVMTDPAAGGVGSEYFLDVLKRLGIVDVMKPRLTFTSGAGTYNADLVASGRAEVAVQLSHLIRQAHGVRLVPLRRHSS